MNISSCKSCGVKVSLFSSKCPNCGARVFHPIFGVIVAVILAVMVFGSDIIKSRPSYSTELKEENAQLHEDDISQPVEQSENLTLGPGTYVVGEDIPSGKYDCVAASGFGVLRGEVASAGEAGFVQTMGNVSSSVGDDTVSVDAASSYSNLLLQDGDTIYIEMSLSVEFIQK